MIAIIRAWLTNWQESLISIVAICWPRQALNIIRINFVIIKAQCDWYIEKKITLGQFDNLTSGS
jgi:hypothetical protein